MNNELQHYGVLGMKWGRRKNTNSTSSKPQKSKEEKQAKTEKLVIVGASVAAGLLSSSFGAGGVYALTKSETMAGILAPSLGIIGGMKYYEWINS